jgi:membrane protein
MNAGIRQSVNFLFLVVRRLWHGRLSQTAASLSFTTILSLVPMLAIGFGVAAALPLLGDLRGKIRHFVGANLLPGTPGSARILDYVQQFSDKASHLTVFGILMLAVTAMLLLDTISDAFDLIWRGVSVKRKRTLARTLLLYAAIVVLGPVVFGLSVSATSYLAGISMGLAEGIPLAGQFLLKFSTEIITVTGFFLLYMFMPNVRVGARYAMIGGVTAGVLFEFMGRLFAYYITKFPTYTLVYGTFSFVPIFLLWIYFSWLVVLFGALITASLQEVWRSPP